VTEDFCETLPKIKSKMLSKNQERIPRKTRTTQSGGSFFFQTAEREGFERSEQNNLNGCFVNGDRRFLRNIT